jgi:hypothetical protein
MYGYTKLFGSIVSSTIWQEDLPTKVVWITLLAMSDKEGMVEGSVPGLAHMAGVTLEDCERALLNLQKPDKYSRTPDHEGSRIQVVDGGWLILNRAKYRDLVPEEHRRERDRIRQERHRQRQRSDGSDVAASGVTECDNHDLSPQQETETETETEIKTHTSKPESVFDLAVEDIFGYFVAVTHKNPRLYLFSRPRQTKIQARLRFCLKLAKDGLKGAVALAKVAIDRFAASPFHNGQNDRGKKYLDVELLFRSDEYFAKWLDDSNFPEVTR